MHPLLHFQFFQFLTYICKALISFSNFSSMIECSCLAVSKTLRKVSSSVANVCTLVLACVAFLAWFSPSFNSLRDSASNVPRSSFNFFEDVKETFN